MMLAAFFDIEESLVCFFFWGGGFFPSNDMHRLKWLYNTSLEGRLYEAKIPICTEKCEMCGMVCGLV